MHLSACFAAVLSCPIPELEKRRECTMQKLGAVRRAAGRRRAGRLYCPGSNTAGRGPGQSCKCAGGVCQRSFGADEERPVALCSAPGRTEICGNHTDHQRGRVLAGAVDLDFLACAAPNGTDRIRFQSEGWPLVEIEPGRAAPQGRRSARPRPPLCAAWQGS